MNDPVPLGFIPNPLIITLVLPELITHAATYEICLQRSVALDGLGNSGDWRAGLHHNMNVIGHQAKGSQLIECKVQLTKSQCIDYTSRDVGVPQPCRSRDRAVEGAIVGEKSPARIAVGQVRHLVR